MKKTLAMLLSFVLVASVCGAMFVSAESTNLALGKDVANAENVGGDVTPVWIDTADAPWYGPDAVQQPAGRVGVRADIANMVLYLCSYMAGFITGENICIDGGMTRQMIYHGDCGWSLDAGK